MRCFSSDGRRRLTSAGRRAPRLLAAAALALAGCRTTQEVSYLPSPENPRFAPAEGERALAQFLGVECERLAGTPAAEGTVDVLVATDSAGAVQRATLAASTGDAQLDGLLGTVVAQLVWTPPAAPPARLAASWRCAPAVEARLEPRLAAR